jgi:DNA-binding NarL/FixJ family response regulator
MSDFSKIARLASLSPETLWLTLSAHDAPLAMSEALSAVAAAVLLDSGWATSHNVFEPIFS